jgi:hypothetical protein
MRTLGIVFLVLLALFFGGCAVTALVFTSMDSTLFVVAVIAAGLCVACIAGIRALNRKPDAGSPDATPLTPPPGEDDQIR